MIGEKFIEKKIEGNKIIRVHEWKEFNHDFESLISDLNCFVSDDWEKHLEVGLYMNANEEFDNFDADLVLEWVEETIQEKKDDEEEEGDYAWLVKWIEPLKEAKEYQIHLHQTKP